MFSCFQIDTKKEAENKVTELVSPAEFVEEELTLDQPRPRRNPKPSKKKLAALTDADDITNEKQKPVVSQRQKNVKRKADETNNDETNASAPDEMRSQKQKHKKSRKTGAKGNITVVENQEKEIVAVANAKRVQNLLMRRHHFTEIDKDNSERSEIIDVDEEREVSGSEDTSDFAPRKRFVHACSSPPLHKSPDGYLNSAQNHQSLGVKTSSPPLCQFSGDDFDSLQHQQPCQSSGDNFNSPYDQQPLQSSGGHLNSLQRQQPLQSSGGNFNSPQHQQPLQSSSGNFNSPQHQQPLQSSGDNFNSPQHQQPLQSSSGNFNSTQYQEPLQSSGGNFNLPQHQQPLQSSSGNFNSTQHQEPLQSSGGNFNSPQHQQPLQSSGGNFNSPQHQQPPTLANRSPPLHCGNVDSPQQPHNYQSSVKKYTVPLQASDGKYMYSLPHHPQHTTSRASASPHCDQATSRKGFSFFQSLQHCSDFDVLDLDLPMNPASHLEAGSHTARDDTPQREPSFSNLHTACSSCQPLLMSLNKRLSSLEAEFEKLRRKQRKVSVYCT